MDNTTQYISVHSGEQIEKAVALFNNTKYAHRACFTHKVYRYADPDSSKTPRWMAHLDLNNNIDYYYIDITLTGVYDQGDYPMVYFLDTQLLRYETDYQNISNLAAKDKPTLRIYSNVDIEGDVVEISNVSTSPYLTL